MKIKANYNNYVIVIKLISNKTPRKAPCVCQVSQEAGEGERQRQRERETRDEQDSVVRPPGGYRAQGGFAKDKAEFFLSSSYSLNPFDSSA